jgi:hypothetical protein
VKVNVFVFAVHTQVFSGGMAMFETLILPLPPANCLLYGALKMMFGLVFVDNFGLLVVKLDPPLKWHLGKQL